MNEQIENKIYLGQSYLLGKISKEEYDRQIEKEKKVLEDLYRYNMISKEEYEGRLKIMREKEQCNGFAQAQ